ncbi:hypothetical protein N781_09525 [Pontibacillus halophilus JSM 076056 = DSM 19796]|uniref:Endonuclease/exonuclease/phosphatase domain-containing protein n=1 Tax=Pontibacillus halophilus JSM 076056 = DSM 19796 TaxID=1385510 RepID=A0A0A5GC18_9BACI|nr:endonuclease/exonuclease/phosphatase family protein [Pontibacillus halophilus]KGX88748.1 hypothetical protein N781_09525 [Pontibacillus halophilus JSM 076056 = DSM 19796]
MGKRTSWRQKSVVTLSLVVGGLVVPWSLSDVEATEAAPSIHDIQSESHHSPYDGEQVSGITGIVTYLTYDGFYMQHKEENYDDNPATSEGIHVKTWSDVSVGDEVTVDGQVTEAVQDNFAWFDFSNDLSVTSILADEVTIQSQGHALPTAVTLGEEGRTIPSRHIDDDQLSSFDVEEDAIDFYESLEGMRVSAPNAKVVMPRAEYTYYDETAVVVPNGTSTIVTPAGGIAIEGDRNPERILVDDYSQNMRPVNVGNTFKEAITGVMGYEFSNFKLMTDGVPNVKKNTFKPEKTYLTGSEEELTVASYNIENYYNDGSGKTNEIAKDIVKNLQSPDIVGVVEMQDDNGSDSGGTDATANYQALVKAIEKNGGPSYAFTDIAPQNNEDGGQPDGNIRVGYLYNPERVSLVEGVKGDATTAVEVLDDGELSLNPGRIDPTHEAFQGSRKSLAAQFSFDDEIVTVIANHFTSKGGDDALFGAIQPPQRHSEVQRVKQASVVNYFVDQLLKEDNDANIVVLGDMNDLEFSDTLNALEGNVLTNKMESMWKKHRYTYNYQGNSQALDHILVTNHLADNTVFDVVHVNADFTEKDGRVSDHDPVLAKLFLDD